MIPPYATYARIPVLFRLIVAIVGIVVSLFIWYTNTSSFWQVWGISGAAAFLYNPFFLFFFGPYSSLSLHRFFFKANLLFSLWGGALMWVGLVELEGAEWWYFLLAVGGYLFLRAVSGGFGLTLIQWITIDN